MVFESLWENEHLLTCTMYTQNDHCGNTMTTIYC